MSIAAVFGLPRILRPGSDEFVLVVGQRRHISIRPPQDPQRAALPVEHTQFSRWQIRNIGDDRVSGRRLILLRQVAEDTQTAADHATTRQ
ncbi:MAG: hypothetical protein IPK02_07370 [Candidatus Accumulibacter sp.]|uniref:Uncharacterized protein n=1 Tax=Candidatus Accumulibacter affinis TaxID=2954384 RepID=A0A935TA86_9PROT|nr:hypothetical protein [Candidatus Accumulibacter affinis]